ncbi:hypothetical protein [Flavobacterium hercynium]|uniref:Uncharacterized protein n=1 Tax=Flavobacterium hercynium TaxID=387094 RepID=A0A226GZD1_9FLAO|nr:hypothetical protein [Flavobacterium hercynium]OXA87409.1 hypothetical protein B0A66_16600 [Flavobacterium hercynium]SMP27419.1 hypothetical protein SAMN06265346_110114 [Flavobacterium hercynium]
MRIIFNYTYYRIAKFYFKRDGLEAFTALLTISLIKAIYLMDIIFLIRDLFLDVEKANKVHFSEKIVVLLILFLIYLFNRKQYKGKYILFREKWSNEQKTKKQIKGFLVILFILSPLLLLFIIASIFGRTIF